MCNAARLWFEELAALNALGGFQTGHVTDTASGDNTVGFEVLLEDSTSSAGGGTVAAQAVIARGAQVIIAPYSSTLTPEVAVAAGAAGVAVVSWGAASEDVFRCPAGLSPAHLAVRPARYDSPRHRHAFRTFVP